MKHGDDVDVTLRLAEVVPRETGVRVALGASPWRILRAVFRQPLRQLGMGLLGGSTALMTIVCLTACVVPTRPALAVQPTEALRDS